MERERVFELGAVDGTLSFHMLIIEIRNTAKLHFIL